MALIEPGPITPLDVRWFEIALERLPPLDPGANGAGELAAAADAIDSILVTAGPVDPPPPEEDDDTRALDAGVGNAAQMQTDASQGFPQSIQDNLDVGGLELINYEHGLTNQPIGLNPPTPTGPTVISSPLGQAAYDAGIDISLEQQAVNDELGKIPPDAGGGGGGGNGGGNGGDDGSGGGPLGAG